MDRLWVKALLYPFVGISLFFFFVWLTFPNEELEKITKTNLEAALGNNYTVEFGEFGLSGLTGVEAFEANIQSKPPPLTLSEEERKAFKRVNMTIDRLEIDVAAISSLTGTPSADFEVELGEGTLEGTYTQATYEPVVVAPKSRTPRRKPKAKPGKDDEEEAEEPEANEGEEDSKTAQGHQIEAVLEEIPLRAIAILQAYTGAPLVGTLGGTLMSLMSNKGALLDLDSDLTIGRVAYGPGELPFDTGFGKFKLETPLRLGDITFKTHVEDGKLILDEFKSTGPDLIIEAEGNIRLSATMSASRAQINMRLKPAKEFLKKNDLDAILGISPKIRNAKAGDWYGVLISGPMGRLSFHPSSRTASGLGKPGAGKKGK